MANIDKNNEFNKIYALKHKNIMKCYLLCKILNIFAQNNT